VIHTTPIATAANGPTVYVHLPSSTPILILVLGLLLLRVRFNKFNNPVSVGILSSRDPIIIFETSDYFSDIG